jgi:hypothetical protein
MDSCKKSRDFARQKQVCSKAAKNKRFLPVIGFSPPPEVDKVYFLDDVLSCLMVFIL